MSEPGPRVASVLPFDVDWLPYRLDVALRRVLWVRMDAAQRERAAFLDDRALPADVEGTWAPLDAWPASMGDAPCDAIFHIGHCGSTLLSRVLGTWPGVQALREPMALRTLAAQWPGRGAMDAWLSTEALDRVFDATWSALSRTADGGRTLVKATSSCNALIAPLLMRRPTSRVVLLDMPLRAYLATLLKSPGSMGDALAAAPERLLDLRARGHGDDWALHALDPATQCAMGWLAERVRFDALHAAHPTRVLRVDFHALLADRAGQLARIADFLGLDLSQLDPALRDDAWGRYAKAESHAYDSNAREHDLALSVQRNSEAIGRARAWVDHEVARDPALQRVIAGALTDG